MRMPEVPRFGARTLLVSTALAALAAAMVIVVLGGADGDDGTASTIPTIQLDPDQPVDPVTASFTEYDGTEVLFSSLRGTPTLINFFASTCTPCITEMPDLEAVHQQLGDRVTFLGLALQDRVKASQELIERTGVTYRTAQDQDGSIFQLLEGQLLPTTVLLDADGKVVATHAGQLDAQELRDLIGEELGIRA